MNNVTAGEGAAHGSKTVTVKVNRQQVVLTSKDVTGSEIKTAAIEQGVTTVYPDSRLFRKVGESWVPVPDSKSLVVHQDETFRAQGRQEDS